MSIASMIHDAFLNGGWGMYPTFFFGALTLLAASVYAFRPEARFVPMLVSGGLLTLTAGALGFVTGLIATFEAAGAAPDRGIALVGAGESLNCLGLAFALLAAALIATTIGTIRIARGPTTAA